MNKIKQFEDLQIWQNANIIAVRIYELTEKGPLSTDFDTKAMVRRIACQIPNEIAKGFAFNNNADFVTQLKIAKGTTAELRSTIFFLYQAKLFSKEASDYFQNDLAILDQQLMKTIEAFMAPQK